MGSSARPIYDAGNDRTLERRSHRQVACRGCLTIRPNPPETTSDPALLHHHQGHDRAGWGATGVWVNEAGAIPIVPSQGSAAVVFGLIALGTVLQIAGVSMTPR